MSEKAKKIGIILYVIGLIFGFFYVKSVLRSNSVKVRTKEDAEVVQETKDAKVTLNIKIGTTSSSYEYDLTDSDSVLDLLNSARKQGYIYYEIVEYAEKTDINFFDSADNSKYKSEFFIGDTLTTSNLRETKLVDKTTYTLKLSKTN